MSHFRRRSGLHKHQDRSSDWVYPKVAKGTSERARFGSVRRVQRALMELRESDVRRAP